MSTTTLNGRVASKRLCPSASLAGRLFSTAVRSTLPVLAGLALLGGTSAYGAPAASNPIPYSTGFEENQLPPFFTLSAEYGTASLVKDFAYDGTHARKLQSTSGGNRAISLQHSFGTLTKGTVSIAFYDTAPGQQTLYEQLSISNSKSPGSSVSVGTMDFDQTCMEASMVSASGTTTGANADCGIYPQQSTSPVRRTAGWHILTIAVGLATEIAIDGQIVFTGPPYTFDSVKFEVSGPAWRGNTLAYIDSFSYTPLTY